MTIEHEGNGVTTVIGFDGDDVIISGALEHLGHVSEIHPHGEVHVAHVVLEAFGSKQERHQRHMAGIDVLEREAGAGAVEVGIVDQILDRFENLL